MSLQALSAAGTSIGLLPHRSCLIMREDLIWLHVVSDALIALAYFAIPIILVYFDVHRRQRFYSWVLLLFAAFILLCGVTHVFGIWTMWVPDYYAEGFVKAATAIVSLATAAALLPEVPKLLALRSPEELAALNRQLEREAAARGAMLNELNQTVDKLRESNQEIERLAFVTSHDLKAPLRSISSFTSLLERRLGDKVDPESAEFFAYIRTGVQQMQDMTDDLLQLYQVKTAGEERQSVNLGDVARRALDQFEAVIHEYRAKVQIGELPTVVGSEEQLLVLFRNLLGNAIKFHRPGVPPVVSIQAVEREDEVEVSVCDNGCGVDPQHRQVIFETFRRLHTSDEYPGTGIGLSLCAKIVERHGGRIWVTDPEHGPGICFHFTLAKVSGGAAREAASGPS